MAPSNRELPLRICASCALDGRTRGVCAELCAACNAEVGRHGNTPCGNSSVHAFLLQTTTLLPPGLPSFRTVCIPSRRSQSCVRQWPVRCWAMKFACAWRYPAVRLAITCCFLEILMCRCLAGAHTPHRAPLLLPHCTPVRPRVAPPREMNMHLLPVSPGVSTLEAHWPQINSRGRCEGLQTPTAGRVLAPTPKPGVANRPSSGACCVGMG